MKILFASSEIYPYAKSGGLADVANALPQAMKSLGNDIVSVMPLYSFMPKNELKKHEIDFSLELGGIRYDIQIYSSKNSEVEVLFIEAPLLSASASLYGNDEKSCANNDLRFGIFSAALVELASRMNIDVLHLNDWHCALSALWAKENPKYKFKTLFSIHNLAYQGVFEADSLLRLGIDPKYFHMDALEFYGKANFMKAGIMCCDALSTVSPRYAKEILTPEFGCGLEGFLKKHSDKLTGVLNGINTKLYDSKTDEHIVCNYDASTLGKKEENKKSLLKELRMKNSKWPLFAMVSRMVHQKGFDLLIEALPSILNKKLNVVLLVEGDEHYYNALSLLAKRHTNLKLRLGYDEALSRRFYAGADFLLMPSLFEPCGLNQMIATRYGTIPIAHRVGGLYDTVHERGSRCAKGVVFSKPEVRVFANAIKRALSLSLKERLEMQKFNLQCDFSFEKSAQKYLKLYKKILE